MNEEQRTLHDTLKALKYRLGLITDGYHKLVSAGLRIPPDLLTQINTLVTDLNRRVAKIKVYLNDQRRNGHL